MTMDLYKKQQNTGRKANVKNKYCKWEQMEVEMNSEVWATGLHAWGPVS